MTCKLLDCGFKTIFIVVNDNTELENQNFDRFLRASQLNPSPLRDSQVNELMPDQLRMDVPRVVFCRKNSPRLQSLITNSRHFKNRVVIDDEADFATPNTKINKEDNESTAIHKYLGELVKLDEGGIYIGVTATPGRLDLNNTFLNKSEHWVFLNSHQKYKGRDFFFPDRIVIGTSDKRANKLMNSLYAPLLSKGAKYVNSSRRGAELIKYASNAFLATKITFINELANLSEKIGVNIEDISIGMGLDKRIGGRFLRAGPAYGGSCFPKDTRAIVDTAKEFKTDLSIIKNVIKSNENRSKILLNRVSKLLKNKIKNKRITFLGVTFKANTDDMRESSSLIMIPSLISKGAKIKYYDPSGYKKDFDKFKNVSFSENIKSACIDADMIIIHTEWNDFKALNFKKLSSKKNVIVYDMRNILSPDKMKKDKINYFGIGR